MGASAPIAQTHTMQESEKGPFQVLSLSLTMRRLFDDAVHALMSSSRASP